MRICKAVQGGHIEPRHVSTKLSLSGMSIKSFSKEVITALYDSMRGAASEGRAIWGQQF